MKQYVFFALLLCGIIFPQKIDDTEFLVVFGGKAFNKSFEPVNLDTNVTQTQVTFIGDKNTTKVSKDSGGTRAVAYMRVWIDSSNVIQNGTFADSSVWTITNSNITISGGLCHFTAVPSGKAIQQSTLTNGSYYTVTYTISNYSSGTAYALLGSTLLTGRTANGTYVESGYCDNYYDEFSIINIGTATFDIDNVSAIPYVDSTQGYSHTIGRPTDTTTFYYSQSVEWTQKDGDTYWLAAATDTVTVYPYVVPASIPYMVTADGDTMFTADGDTMKTLGFIQFDFLQFNNGEKNETDFISDRSVFAVLNERKRTMELYS